MINRERRAFACGVGSTVAQGSIRRRLARRGRRAVCRQTELLEGRLLLAAGLAEVADGAALSASVASVNLDGKGADSQVQGAGLGRTIYVDDRPAGPGSGTSWADSYTSLQTAIAAALPGDEIWVAAGTYRPTAGTSRTATFQLKDGVAIYGGFSDGGGTWAQRNPTSYISLLSGEISGGRSYHVVSGSGTGAAAVLDGFTISFGLADGPVESDFCGGGGMYINNGSPTVRNCAFKQNKAGDGTLDGDGLSGGAIYMVGGSSPAFEKCRITDNVAGNGWNGGDDDLAGSGGDGGGVYVGAGCAPSFVDCYFENNRAGNGGDGYLAVPHNNGGDGGAIFNAGDTTLTRCTIRNNYAGQGGSDFGPRGTAGDGGHGGGISNEGTTRLVACDLIGNKAGDGGWGFEGGDDPLDAWYGGAEGGSGGAIFGGTVMLTGCIISTNAAGSAGEVPVPNQELPEGVEGGAGGSGGGICCTSLTLVDSAVYWNRAGAGADGGMGLYLVPELGFSDAFPGGAGGAGGMGGGICAVSFMAINSTISGNAAGAGGAGGRGGDGGGTGEFYVAGGDGGAGGVGGAGGGVYATNVVLTNCTIAGCVSGEGGAGGEGGYYENEYGEWTSANPGAPGSVGAGGGIRLAGGTLNNSIVARNRPGTSTTLFDDGSGAVTASYNNLVGTPGFVGISDGVDGNRIGTISAPLDPMLKTLANYGGHTGTHALLPGSPAINGGNNSKAVDANGNPLVYDQRGAGYPRFIGTVDIGAFEATIDGAPVADPNGPYTIAEGQSLALDGSASVNAASYAWDVNGDNVFTDAAGATPSLNWAQLGALGVQNGPASWIVSLRVTDAAGNTDTASTALTVNNAPPTATFSASVAAVNEGSAVTFKFISQNDPSLADQIAGYTYSYDLNGDGDYTDAVDLNGTSYDVVSPLMNDSGIYNIHGRIIDRDGAFSEYTVALAVKNVAPKVLAGPDVAAAAGAPLTLGGSFTDVAGDGPWTATVDYGDKTGVKALVLSGQNFSLSHTYTTVGTYSITVKVTDQNGGVGSDVVVVTLPLAYSPAASLTSFAAPVLGSSAAVNLVVRYSDDVSLNAATVGAGDISVVAPNGTILATTFISKTSSVNAPVISATYSLKPPGGGVWDSPDNGLYQVLLNGRQIADITSLYAAPATLGGSTVSLAPVLVVSGALTVYGTSGADVISLGTSGTSYSVIYNGVTYSGTGSFTKIRIAGLEGNDILTYNGSLPGTLEGGAGDDILNGGSNADQLYGGAGSDKLAGGLGNDAYWFESASAMEREEVVEAAGGGTDRLDFSKLPYFDGVRVDLSGATTTIVQQLNRTVTATLVTAANLENLTGGAGADSLTGNALVNALAGNAGNDILRGEAGNDALTGGEGSDALIGGAGNDSYTFATAVTVQADSVDEKPGGGVDTLSFASLAATDPLWVDLRSDVPVAKHKNRLVWTPLNGAKEIENVNGGSGADQIWGNAAVNVLKAGSGNDWIFSRGDAIKDMVDGGVGMDTAEADVLDVITTAEVIHRA